MGDLETKISTRAAEDYGLWFAELYAELRVKARILMTMEPSGQTLQATALVHEAFLRVQRSRSGFGASRPVFFAAVAETMRRILVERARAKRTLKRGQGKPLADIDSLDIADESEPELIQLVNDAVDRLETSNEVCAQLVKLRFFCGVSNAEAAEFLGLSERTGKRYWDYARAWLRRELDRDMRNS